MQKSSLIVFLCLNYTLFVILNLGLKFLKGEGLIQSEENPEYDSNF